MIPVTSVESLQQHFPKSFCLCRHHLHLVQNRTHSAFYSIVDYGTIRRKYALFMIISLREFPDLMSVALVPEVSYHTILPLQEIPMLPHEAKLEEIASISVDKKKVKIVFKTKGKDKWRIQPGNEATLSDWTDLMKLAIHRQNLMKTMKFTTLKTEWEYFKSRLAEEGGEKMYRESERFKQQKQLVLQQSGYSLNNMARCVVCLKRTKEGIQREFSLWKSDYRQAIDENSQMKMISRILSNSETNDST